MSIKLHIKTNIVFLMTTLLSLKMYAICNLLPSNRITAITLKHSLYLLPPGGSALEPRRAGRKLDVFTEQINTFKSENSVFKITGSNAYLKWKLLSVTADTTIGSTCTIQALSYFLLFYQGNSGYLFLNHFCLSNDNCCFKL